MFSFVFFNSLPFSSFFSFRFYNNIFLILLPFWSLVRFTVKKKKFLSRPVIFISNFIKITVYFQKKRKKSTLRLRLCSWLWRLFSSSSSSYILTSPLKLDAISSSHLHVSITDLFILYEYSSNENKLCLFILTIDSRNWQSLQQQQQQQQAAESTKVIITHEATNKSESFLKREFFFLFFGCQ